MGGERTKNKRTIWAWVNSKWKKGGSVTLHALCICRLMLTCICAKLLQATRNANSCLTVFLTADRCRLRTANSYCLTRLVSSAVCCRLPLSVPLRQLLLWVTVPTAFSGVPLVYCPGFCRICLSSPTSSLVGDLDSKPFCLVFRLNRQMDRLLGRPPT